MHPPQDDADTHDDFKPKFQPEPRAGNIADTIRADISHHKVFVYMKVRGQLIIWRCAALNYHWYSFLSGK